MITNLQNLVDLLDQVTQRANQAHEATQRLTTSTGSAATSLSSLSSLMSSTSAHATATAQTVTTTLTDLHHTAEQTQTQIATRLDDLQEAIKDHSNLWNKAVSELIDAVKLGAVPVRQLLDLYADAQIGGQTLYDYLDGFDFTVYRNQVSDLIQGLREGTIEIAKVQEYLSQSQLFFAQRLNEMIELFRQGRVTLKRVQEIVAQIEKAFPDSQFADLAEAVANALRNSG